MRRGRHSGSISLFERERQDARTARQNEELYGIQRVIADDTLDVDDGGPDPADTDAVMRALLDERRPAIEAAKASARAVRDAAIDAMSDAELEAMRAAQEREAEQAKNAMTAQARDFVTDIEDYFTELERRCAAEHDEPKHVVSRRMQQQQRQGERGETVTSGVLSDALRRLQRLSLMPGGKERGWSEDVKEIERNYKQKYGRKMPEHVRHQARVMWEQQFNVQRKLLPPPPDAFIHLPHSRQLAPPQPSALQPLASLHTSLSPDAKSVTVAPMLPPPTPATPSTYSGPLAAQQPCRSLPIPPTPTPPTPATPSPYSGPSTAQQPFRSLPMPPPTPTPPTPPTPSPYSGPSTAQQPCRSLPIPPSTPTPALSGPTPLTPMPPFSRPIPTSENESDPVQGVFSTTRLSSGPVGEAARACFAFSRAVTPRPSVQFIKPKVNSRDTVHEKIRVWTSKERDKDDPVLTAIQDGKSPKVKWENSNDPRPIIRAATPSTSSTKPSSSSSLEMTQEQATMAFQQLAQLTTQLRTDDDRRMRGSVLDMVGDR